MSTALLQWDALHCSEDNSVRVATVGNKFFVSILGDNFTGPFKTFDLASEYGKAQAAWQQKLKGKS